MSSHNTSECYIANRDIPLVKDDGQGNWVKEKALGMFRGLSPGSSGRVLKGELIAVGGYTSKGTIHGTMASDHSKKIECPKDNVSSLTETEYQLLSPIKMPGERWDLFDNKKKMQIIQGLKSDNRVWVSIPVNEGSMPAADSNCLHGTIRYIGPLQEEIGTYFGIELDVSLLYVCNKSWFA